MLPSRSLYKNSFQNRGKKNITVYVAVHEAWDFLVNMDTCFCLKAPACPQADEVEQFPPSHKYGYLLCFRLRLLCLFHSRYAFFFFFPPRSQFLYVASCHCVAEVAQAFVLEQC